MVVVQRRSPGTSGAGSAQPSAPARLAGWRRRRHADLPRHERRRRGRPLPLDGDSVRVDWAGAGDRPVFDRNAEVLQKMSAALGARFVGNPCRRRCSTSRWSPCTPWAAARWPTTAAPASWTAGRVFTGLNGEVHDGLVVADGAIVPRPLAVNPAADHLGAGRAGDRARGRRPGVERPDRPTAPAVPPSVRRPGVTFTERMAGWAAPSVGGDAVEGERRGRAEGTPLEFVLTVGIDDLEGMLRTRRPRDGSRARSRHRRCRRSGCRLVDGTFRLMQHDLTHVDTWHMRYSMLLVAEDGAEFGFEGTKYLHDRSGFDAWADTTTLYVTQPAGPMSWPPVSCS